MPASGDVTRQAEDPWRTDPAHPALDYLLVEVRPSPFAPHMVDGVYWGRGKKKRIRLTDPQVLRYHAQRVGVEERTHRMLEPG